MILDYKVRDRYKIGLLNWLTHVLYECVYRGGYAKENEILKKANVTRKAKNNNESNLAYLNFSLRRMLAVWLDSRRREYPRRHIHL